MVKSFIESELRDRISTASTEIRCPFLGWQGMMGNPPGTAGELHFVDFFVPTNLRGVFGTEQ